MSAGTRQPLPSPQAALVGPPIPALLHSPGPQGTDELGAHAPPAERGQGRPGSLSDSGWLWARLAWGWRAGRAAEPTWSGAGGCAPQELGLRVESSRPCVGSCASCSFGRERPASSAAKCAA